MFGDWDKCVLRISRFSMYSFVNGDNRYDDIYFLKFFFFIQFLKVIKLLKSFINNKL